MDYFDLVIILFFIIMIVFNIFMSLQKTKGKVARKGKSLKTNFWQALLNDFVDGINDLSENSRTGSSRLSSQRRRRKIVRKKSRNAVIDFNRLESDIIRLPELEQELIALDELQPKKYQSWSKRKARVKKAGTNYSVGEVAFEMYGPDSGVRKFNGNLRDGFIWYEIISSPLALRRDDTIS